MSKSHKNKLSKKIRKAELKGYNDCIKEKLLPMAINFLVSQWGQELSELISQHDNPSERIIAWDINPRGDFFTFPSEDLSFPLKKDFVKKYIEIFGIPWKLDGYKLNAINSLTPENHVKIVVLYPTFVQDVPLHHLQTMTDLEQFLRILTKSEFLIFSKKLSETYDNILQILYLTGNFTGVNYNWIKIIEEIKNKLWRAVKIIEP